MLSIVLLLFYIGIGGKKGSVEKCGACKGSGMQVRIQQLGPGIMQQIQSVCGECRGEGEKIKEKDRCKTCNGQKTVKEKKVLEVHIDKGMYSLFIFTHSHYTGYKDLRPQCSIKCCVMQE